MLDIANAIKLIVGAGGIASILYILSLRQRSGLQIAWAVFCAGLAAVMIRDVYGDATGALTPALAIAGCASCSCFWLVSRGLFRPDVGFGWPHALLVGGIFSPAILNQSLIALSAERVIGQSALDGTLAASSSFQLMLSSTVLVLAFWEGLRGWKQAESPTNRRLRIGFLAAYGLCVSICVALLDHGDTTRFSESSIALLQAICGASIFFVAGFGVIWRTRHPILAPTHHSAAEPVPATDDERALGTWVRKQVERDALYLDPDLKVASLARRLREPDYRISRAITAGLGERNFNRFVNRYRIDHAKARLHDPSCRDMSILNIALDSGFASIGPFNRAFKESEGMTPRQYRLETGSAGEVSALHNVAAE
ncbi:AraC family transcriptional regulator [uncultured Maricaulis sp.]|uniref:helix-turn-helix domain-containing protein n=1 Tax=uncultured Maricaulis sp. TaxID=174710 RepID=UPI00261BF79F|nr:helix-turn-helix domain-containing protein [uncultured Maricaulis sp.]